MYEVSVMNDQGHKLVLYPNPAFELGGIDGLTPTAATISSSPVTGGDGSVLASTRIGPRNIVVPIYPQGRVSAARQELYKHLAPKTYVRFRFRNDVRDSFINGYVESLEGSLFDNPEVLTASIVCLDPFWRDAAEVATQLCSVVNAFEFPFSLDEEGAPFSEVLEVLEVGLTNAGESRTGILATMAPHGHVVDPVLYDATNRTRFAIGGIFDVGDLITVNTRRGEKSVALRRNATDFNLINSISEDSTWIQLNPGETRFALGAAEGADLLDVRIWHYNLYQGV